jgi:hypothetical protein
MNKYVAYIESINPKDLTDKLAAFGYDTTYKYMGYLAYFETMATEEQIKTLLTGRDHILNITDI